MTLFHFLLSLFLLKYILKSKTQNIARYALCLPCNITYLLVGAIPLKPPKYLTLQSKVQPICYFTVKCTTHLSFLQSNVQPTFTLQYFIFFLDCQKCNPFSFLQSNMQPTCQFYSQMCNPRYITCLIHHFIMII